MAVSSVTPYASPALSNAAAASTQPGPAAASGASVTGGSDSYSTGTTPDSGTYNAASGDSSPAPADKKKQLTPGEIAGIVGGTVLGAGGIATIGALGFQKNGWFRKKEAAADATATVNGEEADAKTPETPNGGEAPASRDIPLQPDPQKPPQASDSDSDTKSEAGSRDIPLQPGPQKPPQASDSDSDTKSEAGSDVVETDDGTEPVASNLSTDGHEPPTASETPPRSLLNRVSWGFFGRG